MNPPMHRLVIEHDSTQLEFFYDSPHELAGAMAAFARLIHTGGSVEALAADIAAISQPLPDAVQAGRP